MAILYVCDSFGYYVRMSIIRLQHYGLTVSDHRSSSRFYSKVFRIPKLGSVVQKPRRSMIGRHLGAPTVRISWHQRGHDSVELFSFPGIEREPLPTLRRDFSRPGPARISFRTRSVNGFKLILKTHNIEHKKATDPWGEEFLSFTDPDAIPVAVYGGAEKGMNLEHCTITVADLNRSMAFYSVVLGLPETTAVRLGHVRDIFPDSKYDCSVRVARLGIEGKGVELVEFQDGARSDGAMWYPDPGTPYDSRYTDVGIKHVCFQAKGSIKWVKKLKADGVRIIMGPEREPSGLWVTYLLDPDGTMVELYDLPQSLTKVMRGVSLFWARVMTKRF